MSWKTIKTILKPYEGVIRFAIVMVLANLFWKLTMKGDESDRILIFLGMNLTPIFAGMTHFVAEACYGIYRLFSDSVLLMHNTLRFDNGNMVNVVWGCNGLKQMFIFTCILLFSRGPLKHKLWYIALGLLVVNILNIARVTFLAYLVEYHLSWFDLFHSYILKYLFYACIFLMWVFWEEVLLPRFRKSKETKAPSTTS